jgi:hypothetical protein
MLANRDLTQSIVSKNCALLHFGRVAEGTPSCARAAPARLAAGPAPHPRGTHQPGPGSTFRTRQTFSANLAQPQLAQSYPGATLAELIFPTPLIYHSYSSIPSISLPPDLAPKSCLTSTWRRRSPRRMLLFHETKEFPSHMYSTGSASLTYYLDFAALGFMCRPGNQ